jgi:hypothetical protein
MLSIYYHSADVVKVLLERGADISIVSRDNLIPLYFGIISGHVRILKLLLDKIEAQLSSDLEIGEVVEEEEKGNSEEEYDKYGRSYI